MIVMVEQGAEWPKLPSGQRRSFNSLVHEGMCRHMEQTGREPSVIMIDHQVEHELVDNMTTRFDVNYQVTGTARGKYLRGIRLVVTSDVQLAVA